MQSLGQRTATEEPFASELWTIEGAPADQDEVKDERVTATEVAAIAPRLENVGARRGLDPAQERWRRADNECLEKTGVETCMAQPAGPARLLPAHGTDHPA